MAPAPRFPHTYENVPVREALAVIAAEPTLPNLETLLSAAVAGGLVVDVTGSTPHEPRLRTMRSTAGEPVLPLFTSMKALRHATGQTTSATSQTTADAGQEVQAVIVPALEALGFIRTAEFVAVQFDPGAEQTMIVARAHIEAVLGER